MAKDHSCTQSLTNVFILEFRNLRKNIFYVAEAVIILSNGEVLCFPGQS